MASSGTHLRDMGKLYSPPSFSPQASAPTQGIQCLYRALVTFKFLPTGLARAVPPARTFSLSHLLPPLILYAGPEATSSVLSILPSHICQFTAISSLPPDDSEVQV